MTSTPPARPAALVTLVTLVLLALLAQSPVVTAPFSFDDSYVLAHVSSPRWADRLTAFDVDQPGPDLGAWWDGVHLQRRFVRLAPSLLMTAEVKLLGPDPLRLHLVTLALHVGNVLLLFALLRRLVRHRWAALGGAAVFAAHPVASETIGWWCCQPIVFAALSGLAAALALARWHDRRSPAALVFAWAGSLICITSYEAAIAVPLLLVILDRELARGKTPPPHERISVAAGFLVGWPILAAVTAWTRVGLAASDTTFRPSLGEIWCTGRTDLVNYVLKTLMMVDPHQPGSYWLYNRYGEPVALTIAAGATAPLLVWALRNRASRWALLASGVLLAPPYLIRTFVGVLNNPTLRQLYLPMIALSILVALAVAASRWRLAVAVPLIFAVAAVPFSWIESPDRFDAARISHVQAQVRAALADVPAEVPVLVVGAFKKGSAGCSYALAFDWPQRQQWLLVPPARDGKPVRILREDERTFLATTEGVFDIPLQHRGPRRVSCEPGEYSGFGQRADANPPPIVERGWQDVGEARVELTNRTSDGITGLRFRLERPLDTWTFLAAQGCDLVQKVETE